MKTKSLLLTLAAAFLFVAAGAQTLSKEDRKKAATELKESQKALLEAVKGLSEEQLNYKPTEDSWSIANCVEHLAISEGSFPGLIQSSLKEDAEPETVAAMSDEDLLVMIQDRSHKVKTQTPFEPSGKFGSYEGSLEEFKTKRKENLAYLKSTQDDLRHHYFEFPFGNTDAYQILLFMSGHTRRHLAQIREVMADEGYPSGS